NNTSWLPNCSVGISEITSDNMINVYPNPANNYIVIEAEFDMYSSNIQITDIQGKRIPAKILAQNQKSLVLDVTNLSNGLYFLTINNQTIFSTHKFLKF
ncbi:MAG: hypothetical protein COA97_13150, partial [Flavobacteriales bacterium]